MIYLSVNAFHRIQQMNVGIDEIVSWIEQPTLTYPNPPEHGTGRRLSVHGRIVVVRSVDRDPVVITVLWHGAGGRDVPPQAA